ncbi:MAG: transcription elongation factor spt5 [Sarcosagium campestre]|nr:MAG: transcription elongation factor spt5 [Sarcosagium campestre]
MSTANFLDQEFDSESDEGNFNPAPADDSDHESEASKPSSRPTSPRQDEQPVNRRSEAVVDVGDEDEDDDDEVPTNADGRPDRNVAQSNEADSADEDGDEPEPLNKGPTKNKNGRDEDDNVDDDEENDREEEEEEDEEEGEEDEEDEEITGHRRKRAKKHKSHGFFDVEAEVDEDEDELEDEEDELNQGDGFIVGADTHPDDLADLPAGGDVDDRRHRELDRRREVEAGLDAERQAEEYRKRYGRNRAAATDSFVLPKRLLLPSVDDPSIWGVRCKPGKEKELIFAITKRVEEKATSKTPLTITCAFERGGTMSGYVYVEARKQADILVALDGISNIYPRTKMVLVPIREMPDLLRVKKTKEIEPGAYVRVKRGKYQGDLGLVEAVEQNGLTVELRLVPRLDYGLNEDSNAPLVDNAAKGGIAKRKRPPGLGQNSIANRPPPRLFSEVEARKKHLKYLQSMPGRKNWNYLNETYQNGYLLKEFKIQLLQTENVTPTLEEVSRFVAGSEEGTEAIDLNALAANLKSSNANASYLPGDMVEVYDGEQQGICGKAVTVHGDIVTIDCTEGELKGQTIEVPVKGLRKRFREGDHVKVIGGSRFRDEVGMVVRISQDRVTILCDLTMQEITVFSKDLREATDSGRAGGLGIYDMHDLLQLDPSTVGIVIKVDRESMQVLDQNGSVRSVLPSQISNKLEKRRNAVATDRNGSEIRNEDTVREIGGAGKQGIILHIYRSFLFLQNREQTENSGVFVVRTNNVATVTAKGGRLTGASSSGPDLNKMNPAMQRNGGGGGGANGQMPPPTIPATSGRDRALGRTVTVRRGPYKGLLGIVKDTTEKEARVELHTKGKTITVLKDVLGFKDPVTGATTDYQTLAGGRGRGQALPTPNVGYGGATPRRQPEWEGSRTPMAAALPDRTPAWGQAARTPAWNGGPPANGGRTPAWKQEGMGSRTPMHVAEGARTVNPYNESRSTAYGAGNKTPAWASGSRTPYGAESGFGSGGDSWASGSRTPAHGGAADNAWSGSRTPAYTPGPSRSHDAYPPSRPYDAPTPGGDFAAPTPGALNAPTPGVYGAPTPLASAPTPGLVSAPTPAASAPTPRPWGAESAPTPAALSAPTPGAFYGGGGSAATRAGRADDSAPTPGGYGNAETPGNWGGDDEDGPRYATPSP